MEIASFLRHVRLSSVACQALPRFSTLAYKRHAFRKLFVEKVLGVLIFSATFA